MTRAQTLEAIKALGFHASYDREAGEFRISPGYILAGGRGFQADQQRRAEAAAYYTPDKADALGTAQRLHAEGRARLNPP